MWFRPFVGSPFLLITFVQNSYEWFKWFDIQTVVADQSHYFFIAIKGVIAKHFPSSYCAGFRRLPTRYCTKSALLITINDDSYNYYYLQQQDQRGAVFEFLMLRFVMPCFHAKPRTHTTAKNRQPYKRFL